MHGSASFLHDEPSSIRSGSTFCGLKKKMTSFVRLTFPILLVSYALSRSSHPAHVPGSPMRDRSRRLTMIHDSSDAGPVERSGARDDLMQMVLGGLWPVEAHVETLLDRLEAGRTAR